MFRWCSLNKVHLKLVWTCPSSLMDAWLGECPTCWTQVFTWYGAGRQVREKDGQRRCWDTLGQGVGGGPIGVFNCHGGGGNQVYSLTVCPSIRVSAVVISHPPPPLPCLCEPRILWRIVLFWRRSGENRLCGLESSHDLQFWLMISWLQIVSLDTQWWKYTVWTGIITWLTVLIDDQLITNRLKILTRNDLDGDSWQVFSPRLPS